MRYFYVFTVAQGFTVYDTDESQPVFSRRDEMYCKKWCDRMNAADDVEK